MVSAVKMVFRIPYNRNKLGGGSKKIPAWMTYHTYCTYICFFKKRSPLTRMHLCSTWYEHRKIHSSSLSTRWHARAFYPEPWSNQFSVCTRSRSAQFKQKIQFINYWSRMGKHWHMKYCISAVLLASSFHHLIGREKWLTNQMTEWIQFKLILFFSNHCFP